MKFELRDLAGKQANTVNHSIPFPSNTNRVPALVNLNGRVFRISNQPAAHYCVGKAWYASDFVAPQLETSSSSPEIYEIVVIMQGEQQQLRQMVNLSDAMGSQLMDVWLPINTPDVAARRQCEIWLPAAEERAAGGGRWEPTLCETTTGGGGGGAGQPIGLYVHCRCSQLGFMRLAQSVVATEQPVSGSSMSQQSSVTEQADALTTDAMISTTTPELQTTDDEHATTTTPVEMQTTTLEQQATSDRETDAPTPVSTSDPLSTASELLTTTEQPPPTAAVAAAASPTPTEMSDPPPLTTLEPVQAVETSAAPPTTTTTTPPPTPPSTIMANSTIQPSSSTSEAMSASGPPPTNASNITSTATSNLTSTLELLMEFPNVTSTDLSDDPVGYAYAGVALMLGVCIIGILYVYHRRKRPGPQASVTTVAAETIAPMAAMVSEAIHGVFQHFFF